MKLEGVHHIGYLVKDVEKSAKVFEGIGYKRGGGVFDPIQNADILFMDFCELKVELVAPKKDSDIYPLLKKFKDAPYHICYIVEDLSSAINELLNEGYMMFRSPVPAVAIGKVAKVAFLMKRNMGMLELVQLN